jgi:hypothetical protein
MQLGDSVQLSLSVVSYYTCVVILASIWHATSPS